jgi:hypothetical protein
MVMSPYERAGMHAAECLILMRFRSDNDALETGRHLRLARDSRCSSVTLCRPFAGNGVTLNERATRRTCLRSQKLPADVSEPLQLGGDVGEALRLHGGQHS